MTELYNISRFRETGRLFGQNGFPGFPVPKHFRWTLLLEATLPSEGRGGVTLRVEKQDCEWVVVMFSGCGLKKHRVQSN